MTAMRIFEAPRMSKKQVEKHKNIEYLDSLFRRAVKLKYNNRSFWSGLKADEVHHIISRKWKNLRWYIGNGILLTSKEHTRLHQESAFRAMVIDKFCHEKYEELQQKKSEYFDKDYNKIKQYLKQEIERYANIHDRQ